MHLGLVFRWNPRLILQAFSDGIPRSFRSKFGRAFRWQFRGFFGCISNPNSAAISGHFQHHFGTKFRLISRHFSSHFATKFQVEIQTKIHKISNFKYHVCNAFQNHFVDFFGHFDLQTPVPPHRSQSARGPSHVASQPQRTGVTRTMQRGQKTSRSPSEPSQVLQVIARPPLSIATYGKSSSIDSQSSILERARSSLLASTSGLGSFLTFIVGVSGERMRPFFGPPVSGKSGSNNRSSGSSMAKATFSLGPEAGSTPI